ncbi:MAG: hypothetical protein SFZ23_11150 [Planctomycetota bacterium]|nr:hypothetical protein [Planctomycetota bacterium]
MCQRDNLRSHLFHNVAKELAERIRGTWEHDQDSRASTHECIEHGSPPEGATPVPQRLWSLLDLDGILATVQEEDGHRPGGE